MPETGAIIATYFEGAGAAATVAEGAATATATEGALVAAGATTAEAGVAGEALGTSIAGTAAGTAGATEAGLVAAGATGTEAAAAAGAGGAAGVAGSPLLKTLGTQVATGVGSQLVSGLLAPTPRSSAPAKSTAPNVPPPAAMPDPVAQEQARRKSIIEQLARRGRASTILTQPGGSGSLGG